MRASWGKSAARVRDDDPYHAWQYDRAHDGRYPGRTICPLLIRASAKLPATMPDAAMEHSQDETYPGLLFNLKKIKATLARPTQASGIGPIRNLRLVASAHEIERLDDLIHWVDQEGLGKLTKGAEYLRLLVVYAFEDDLFVKYKDLYWKSPFFEILYAGSAIRDVVTGDRFVGGSLFAAIPDALTVIDDSFAFLHEDFLTSTARTTEWRFSELWLQNVEEPSGHSLDFGIKLDKNSVSSAIADLGGVSEWDLYQRHFDEAGGTGRKCRPLDLSSPLPQPLAHRISHGTHVTSTALNSYAAEAARSKLDLRGVAIPVEVTQTSSGSTIGAYFLAALRQAMLWNDAYYRPTTLKRRSKSGSLVINFSYGFRAGPKDGSDKLSRAVKRLIDARNAIDFGVGSRPTALVVPMGNDRDSRGVAHVETLPIGQSFEVDWIVLPDDGTSSFLEIYAGTESPDATADFDLELLSPDPEIDTLRVHADGSGETYSLECDGHLAAQWGEWEPEFGSVWSRRGFIALGPTLTHDRAGAVPHGRWRIKITNAGSEAIEVLAMIQRDDAPGTYPVIGRQSYFEIPSLPEGTPGDADGTGNFGEILPPLSDYWTSSLLASIDSNHVFAVGAGMGNLGDGLADEGDSANPDLRAVEPSPYASSGPRGTSTLGPDLSGLGDRSEYFRGIYGPGTYSGTQVLLSGSSAAAPQLTGFLAAHPEIVEAGRAYFIDNDIKNPKGVSRPSERFGLIKEAFGKSVV